MNKHLKNLAYEINSFKKWANEVNDKSKEWETDYLQWDRIYLAINEVLRNVPLMNWSKMITNCCFIHWQETMKLKMFYSHLLITQRR